MMQKRGISNRLLYTLVVIGIFAIVGISVYAFGTTAPSSFGHSPSEIDFSDGLFISSSNALVGDIRLGSGGDIFFDGGSDGIFYISNTGGSSGRTSFRTNGTERLTISNANGYVGIGTTNPTSTLTVNGLLTVGGINFASSPSAPSFPTLVNYVPITVNGTTYYLPLYTGGSAPLVNGQHTEAQCIAAGGNVTSFGGNSFCRFNQGWCPTGSPNWVQYQGWSQTIPSTCDGAASADSLCFSTSCTTSSHIWSNNNALEVCSYTYSYRSDPDDITVECDLTATETCYAQRVSIGCY